MEEIKAIIADIQASPRECEWVEIKENNYNPQLIGEYISALSNGAAYMGQSKGYLVFGITDDTHEIKGTDYNPHAEKIGNQELENWLATQLSPRIDFVIHNDIQINGRRVVLFVIDSAGNTPVKFRGVAYCRVGSYKKPLSEHPEIERKIWQNTHNNTFEAKIAKSGLTADEVLQLIDYAAVFRLLKIPYPETKSAILDKLADEKLIHKRASCYDITNMGAILFATDLQKFDILSRKAVRVIFYKGNNKLHAIREQIGSKGYAIGFEGLVNYINERLPMNEEIGKVLRKDNPIYPEIAIREFVANALIHQDFYMGGTSPVIEVYANRMEISNPGKPLIDTLRFIDHTPISRNEQLASIMRRMNFCEERGSGVDRALYQCELYQLPAPDFTTDDFSTKVTMFAPLTLRQMNRDDRVRACYQHCCLKYVAGEKMTNESLRGRLEIAESSYPIASKIISDTIAAGLVRLDDASKSRKYAQYVPKWA